MHRGTELILFNIFVFHHHDYLGIASGLYDILHQNMPITSNLQMRAIWKPYMKIHGLYIVSYFKYDIDSNVCI